MVVTRGPHGEREVVTGRAGARVVSYGPRRGFVERTVRPGYISRTYVAGGRRYVTVYHEYAFRGVHYYRYVPSVYYAPAFYGWAVTPWAAPIRYSWYGMAAPAPWFGFYAGYFAPYPVYASPDLWLTDYLIAQNLRLAYESQYQDANTPPPAAEVAAGSQPTLSPEMKAMIAEEVRQQLAAERQSANQPAPSTMQPSGDVIEQAPPALSQKFFVVASNLDLAVGGQACSLTAGDIIERRGATVGPDNGVLVEVVSSKAGDCERDSTGNVDIAALQEMHNQFREQIDSGLRMLADNQAKGLPQGPAANPRAVAEGSAPEAPDAEALLVSQHSDAVQVESQVGQGGPNN